MIYFTADWHLGHDAVIEFCKRPFKNGTLMDRALIRNHNNIVTDNDDVYFLGDFSIKTKNHRGAYQQWIAKIKGRKHLIMGNHDIRDPIFYSELGFWSVHYPYFEVEEFICVHDPALSAVDRSAKFLCGHVHELFVKIKNCLNVGVDVHDFKPLHIEQVREFFKGD
jgi:calcineurin-like phosphoesterase family protein